MKKIVVIAHDKYKPDMCTFLNDRAPWFYGRKIIATGRTTEYLRKAQLQNTCNTCTKRNGGYNEISKLLREGQVSLVFFQRSINSASVSQ